MRVSQLLSCTICMAAIFVATGASAAPLLVGVPLSPVSGEPEPSAVPPAVLVDTTTQAFSAAPLYSGVLTSTVLSDPANPLGGLTFIYELSNDLVSLDLIQRLTVNSFAGLLVDASYQAPAAGLVPWLVDRSAAGTIGFHFQDAPLGPGFLAPGMTSAVLVLETNSAVYVETFASVIDGTVANVPSFAPAPVPEPAAMPLLIVGAGVLAGYATRRRLASIEREGSPLKLL